MARQDKIGTHKTSIITHPCKGRGSATQVIYHKTAVVTFDYRYIFLESGGYRTNTTKTRMNQASNQFNLGYRVFQKNYDWFVHWDITDHTYPFLDNMKLDRADKIITDSFNDKLIEPL